MKNNVSILSVFAFLFLTACASVQNSMSERTTAAAPEMLAKTPPMGWEAWNYAGVSCSATNEVTLREMADAMVSSGMRDAGYEYIRIDECWTGGRDEHGHIFEDPKRFPHGMKALADYVHSKGLKLGIYTDPGPKTCMAAANVDPHELISKHEGSLGHEYEDAQQYADWGIDHVKNDWCFSKGLNPQQIYGKMNDAIRATGRPMVYNICGWGQINAHKWGASIGAQSWRIGPDIENNWKSVLLITDMMDGLEAYQGPGRWNDPDMLEVGNGVLTPAEERAHFSLWSIFAAPLIAGNDLRKMSAQSIKILTAKEVIAVDQDPLGIQGKRISKSPNEVWVKPLADGSRAVVLFNRSNQWANLTVKWSDIGLKPDGAKVRDLWYQKDLGVANGSYTSKVEPHGVVMVKITQ
jgi:alpha-galactosidase